MYNMVAYIGTHKIVPKGGMYAVEEQEDIGVHFRKEIDNFGIYHQSLLLYF